MVKIIRRNVNFNRETNNYKCKFNDSSTFDILRPVGGINLVHT